MGGGEGLWGKGRLPGPFPCASSARVERGETEERVVSTSPLYPPPQPDSSIAGNTKSPADWIAEAPPIKVHGAVAVSTGSEDPALGCPVEYIDLRGTSVDKPAVCKYTGLRYYSDDWMHSH